MENTKYRLIPEDYKEIFGKKLYRIEALKDFGDVKAGDLGGYIESEDNLSHDGNAWVYDNAYVRDNAWVYGNARVYSNAWVYGNARVYGDAEVYSNARVYGNARVYSNAWVGDNARVYGDAEVYSNAWVGGNARVYSNAWVYGNARVYGDAEVYSDAGWLVVGPIGSRDDFTTFFSGEDGIYVSCGCFYGSISEFEKAVEKTHAGTKHEKDYKLAIALAKSRIVTAEGTKMKYRTGDRVRIVSDRTKNMNSNGGMDKYLGTVMTIKEAHKTVVFGISYHYRMVEDKCEWFWNDEMIAGLASEIPFDFGAWKDKNVCMHCSTREEAEDFCNEMHKAGLTWSSGTSYLKISCFSIYENYTCYCFNEGKYDSVVHAKDKGYTILEWSDYRSTEPKEEQEKIMETKMDDKPLSYQKAVKIKKMICREHGNCNDCPLDEKNNGLNEFCNEAFGQHPNETEKILKKWVAEHTVTNEDKCNEMFLEVFGM